MFLEEGTFGIFPAWICQGRNPIQQAIVSWLWFHKNKEGVCFPSQALLAEECGISVSSANAHLLILEKDGIIVREVRYKEGTKQKYSTLYRLPMYSVKNSTYSATCSTGTPPNGVCTPPNGEEPYPKNQIQLEPKEKQVKEFQKFIEENPSSITAKVASRFMSLGWKPKESVESFREWLTELAKLHKAEPDEIDRCSQEWAVYWKGRDDKKIKNFKTCFGNCPALPNNKTKWKK